MSNSLQLKTVDSAIYLTDNQYNQYNSTPKEINKIKKYRKGKKVGRVPYENYVCII